MSPEFIMHFREHGPKGVTQSLNALCLLLILETSEKPLSRAVLAKRLGITKQACGTLAHRLHAGGYLQVTGEPNPCGLFHPLVKSYSLARPLEAPLPKGGQS